MSDRQFVPPHEEDEVGRAENPIDAVAGYLSAHKWKYDQDEEGIEFAVASDPTPLSIRYSWDGEDEVLTFTCAFRIAVPQRRTQMDKLVLLLNDLVTVGHFEYHPDYESVGYRIGMPVPNGEISYEQVGRLLGLGLNTCEAFASFFERVGQGMSAKSAYAFIANLSDIAGTA